jgi:steroid 21-monooxygenase
VLPRAMTRWPILDSLSGFKLTKDAVDSMVNLISPHIEDRERTLDPTNVRDFLDLMLFEHLAQKDSDSCFNRKHGKIAIVNSLVDLFIAGMETTSSSIVMAVLQLIHHPEVQKKVQNDLDSVRI